MKQLYSSIATGIGSIRVCLYNSFLPSESVENVRNGCFVINAEVDVSFGFFRFRFVYSVPL
jgi:hypothetical protein